MTDPAAAEPHLVRPGNREVLRPAQQAHTTANNIPPINTSTAFFVNTRHKSTEHCTHSSTSKRERDNDLALDLGTCQHRDVNMFVGGRAGVGPAWTRGEMERPAGEKSMGTWTAAVYTPEQQARLGVDEMGQPLEEELATTALHFY